jgi:glycine/D-amino acid oxidase-like deaminating enzyme
LTHPWPRHDATPEHRASFAEAEPRSYWLDVLPPRSPQPPLEQEGECDLCIVGGGYTGLWAALLAKQRAPQRDVVVVEAARCGEGASGRNGGFLNYSLTHGLLNGIARFPGEIAELERLGLANYEELRADLERHAVECAFTESGEMAVALTDAEVAHLREELALLRAYGHDVELLDGPAVRAQVASPVYKAGLWQRNGAALVDPARLADGLREAALRAGVRIHEHSAVRSLRRSGESMLVIGDGALLRARRVLLATSAYRSLVASVRLLIAPVYDYVLMSEPIDAARWAQVGWTAGQGLSDMGNLFHYYRPTADRRILWGGYDAVYRYGGDVGPHRDQDQRTFERLAQHFFATFPQLEGVRFSHRWGGAIDTCSRFSLFVGTAHRGRVAYAAGYTGLGVGASRFGARAALELLDGERSGIEQLAMVRRRPVPFPPEPLRSAVIQLTRNRLAAADRRGGRRGLWLAALDRVGLGFDS